ncbi:MAG: hypothetical protein AAF493_07380 [Pseudomonadota bacterium]
MSAWASTMGSLTLMVVSGSVFGAMNQGVDVFSPDRRSVERAVCLETDDAKLDPIDVSFYCSPTPEQPTNVPLSPAVIFFASAIGALIVLRRRRDPAADPER